MQWKKNFNGNVMCTDRSQRANRLFIGIQFVYNLFSLIFDNLFSATIGFSAFSSAAASKVSITFRDYRIGFYLLLHILGRTPNLCFT